MTASNGSVARTVRSTSIAICAALLLGAPGAWAQDAGSTQRRNGEPGAAEMVADLAVARPIGAAMTVVGTAVFLVSLPFTAAGGNIGEARENLVDGPAAATFLRCLGCRTSGWRQEYEPGQ
jgi:hypothetical protein